MFIAGIDEAGRGPVIGPMVIAGVKIRREDEGKLVELGVKDSKMLLPEQREELFKEIVKLCEYTFEIISPKVIDAYVLKNQLNLLELRYMSKIILKLKPDIVYIDSPSKNVNKVKDTLENLLGNERKIEIIPEPKADRKYPVVSAASIIAKVLRDREIKKIKEKIGIDFGSGYPSDPRTITFLKRYAGEYKEYIRESWMTYKKIYLEKAQSKLNKFFNF